MNNSLRTSVFKAIGIVLTACMLLLALASCSGMTLPKPPFPKPVSDLAFRSFDAETMGDLPEMGFFPKYWDDRRIVLHSDEGLFLFDFEQGRITLSVDYLRLFNAYGSSQGWPDESVSAEVSENGEYIRVLHKIRSLNVTGDPECPDDRYLTVDTYYIHVPSMTYIPGEYGELENRFDGERWFDPGFEKPFEFDYWATYRSAAIKKDGREYKLFADTSFVVSSDKK